MKVLVGAQPPDVRFCESNSCWHSFSALNSTDLSQGASGMAKTRVTTRQESIPSPTQRGTSESVPPSSSVGSSPLSSPGDLPKRKSPPLDPPEIPAAPPRAVKRLRAVWKKEKTTKRKPSKSSIKTTSSRQSTRPPSPEPLFRSSVSRSTSEFPLYDDESPTPRRAQQRVWYTQEHGIPGDEHLSSEMVVKRLMKSYKACAFG